jgi:hypothetical protein
MPDVNPFGEFEDEFKSTEAAKPGSSVGRLPEGVYHGVCTQVDLEGDGTMVDKHIFGGGDKTKALKIFLEILDPEKVGEVTTKGEIHEYVFWMTAKNLPYVKRDASLILGKEVTSLGELATCQWAGHTVEFGLKDETYNGFTKSKVSFFNTWEPKTGKKDADKTKATGAKTSTNKKTAAAATMKEEDVAF